MSTFLPEQVNQIVLFRKSGLAYKKIARRLSVSSSTVHKYAKGIVLDEAKKKSLEHNEIVNQQRFVSKFSKEKEILIPKLDCDFANLLGRLFFDGSVHTNRGKYTLSYTNASEKAIGSFLGNINRCFGLTPSAICPVKGKNVDYFEVYVYSKKAYFFLKKLADCFSTPNGARVPLLIRDSPPDIKAAFLRAFWDDEGCISNSGELVGCSTSEAMIDDLCESHNDLGIECKKAIKRRLKPLYVVRIKKNKGNFHRFIVLVGFEHAIVTKGYHIGKYKKDILSQKFKELYPSN